MSQNTASKHLLVLCTCPGREAAQALARRLLEGRLAACVNIVDPIHSVYRWKGAIEESAELLLLIKTRAARYQELERAIVEHHPYELPEVIAVQIERGLQGYLDWMTRSTDASNGQ